MDFLDIHRYPLRNFEPDGGRLCWGVSEIAPVEMVQDDALPRGSDDRQEHQNLFYGANQPSGIGLFLGRYHR